MNINVIKESHLCYGCGTCNVICNKDAITMQYDNIGRMLPVINEKKCVNCGLCYTICPSLDQKEILFPQTDDCYVGNVINTYVGKACDERIYMNSQSGGLVTAVLKYLFDTGKIDAAIVCKVSDEIEYIPKATMITSASQLYDCQKSSYVPIDMVSAIKESDKYRSIAVVGTGCHIQGFHALKNFKKDYNDRIKYTLGLICDRTLCKTATDVLYAGLFKDERKRIIWRDKSVGYKKARLLIRTEDGNSHTLPRWKRFALKDPFTNPRCRICFDKLNNHADIVFGDPWEMSGIDWKNGMSLVLTRSERGEEIVWDILSEGKAELTKASLSEAIIGQHIEKRKQSVSAVLALYRRMGWQMPAYAERLGIGREVPKLSQQVLCFASDAHLTKEEIIRKNTKKLRSELWRKNRLFRLAVKAKKIIKQMIG